MAEHFGNGVGDKNSQPLVQTEILEGDLPNSIDAKMGSIGEAFGKVAHDALNKMKQMEKQAEGEKIVPEMPGALSNSIFRETYRPSGVDIRGLLASPDYQKRIQTSDCDFGEGPQRAQRLAELEESMRRIRQIDLKPYMWNTTEIRA